ncbi:peptidylprolyl isomerase [Candidatus Woesearchaeota archaeon]|nr:peptidylprolyl isomerase [Candidatus Woesearchaeota archaeon]
MAVKKGDKVKVNYTGTLDDGTVFDSSEKHGQPLEFEVGSKQVIPGFDDALIGMEIGQEKEISIKPEQAYGQPNPQLVTEVPKDKLPQDKELKPGMMLLVTLPNGAQTPAKIVEVLDTGVKLDLNHPLTGKALNFKIKLESIS